MKNLNLMYLMPLLWFLGCELVPSSQEDSGSLFSNVAAKPESKDNDLESANQYARKPVKFEVKFDGLKLLAMTQTPKNYNYGTISILDYPPEWRSKGFLIRYHGEEHTDSPFSQRHCEKIRQLAVQGDRDGSIRSEYGSTLSFNMPPFLANEFPRAIWESANAAGFKFTAIDFKNPVEDLPKVIIDFNDNSISRLIGYTSVFEDQLNLNNNGIPKGSRIELVIKSADIICDLIFGEAILSISYPIKGEDKAIKVIYDSLKVELKPSF